MSVTRFRLRWALILLQIAAAAVAVARWVDAENTLDLTKGREAACAVHNVTMSAKRVELTYGMRNDTPMDDARPRLFPHADEPYDTRACMPSRQQSARVYVCVQCTKARADWLRGVEAP